MRYRIMKALILSWKYKARIAADISSGSEREKHPTHACVILAFEDRRGEGCVAMRVLTRRGGGRGGAARGGAGRARVLWSGGSVRLPAVSNDHLRCREAVTHIDRNRFQME